MRSGSSFPLLPSIRELQRNAQRGIQVGRRKSAALVTSTFGLTNHTAVLTHDQHTTNTIHREWKVGFSKNGQSIQQRLAKWAVFLTIAATLYVARRF